MLRARVIENISLFIREIRTFCAKERAKKQLDSFFDLNALLVLMCDLSLSMKIDVSLHHLGGFNKVSSSLD